MYTHASLRVLAVAGCTGAGKSSLLNALLEHANVLPTSGIKACTSVVVEVRYNSRSKTDYEAEIEFMSAKVRSHDHVLVHVHLFIRTSCMSMKINM